MVSKASVYYCCTEALQDIAKHAGHDARAHITLASQRDEVLRFEVSDDDCGFASTTTPLSGGLQNMTDRVGAVGGTLQITSTPGSGTTVIATISLTTAVDAPNGPLRGDAQIRHAAASR